LAESICDEHRLTLFWTEVDTCAMSNPDVMSRGEPFESATAFAAPTPHMDIQVHASSCLSPIPGPNDLLLSYSSGEVSESTCDSTEAGANLLRASSPTPWVAFVHSQRS